VSVKRQGWSWTSDKAGLTIQLVARGVYQEYRRQRLFSPADEEAGM